MQYLSHAHQCRIPSVQVAWYWIYGVWHAFGPGHYPGGRHPGTSAVVLHRELAASDYHRLMRQLHQTGDQAVIPISEGHQASCHVFCRESTTMHQCLGKCWTTPREGTNHSGRHKRDLLCGDERALPRDAETRAVLMTQGVGGVCKFRTARSRLYRSQILQVDTRWKALDEIYKIYMFLHRSGLNISAKQLPTFC